MMKFLRYAAVGILTLVIYLRIGEMVRGLAMSPMWQASVPFFMAVTANYLLQRSWVFRDSRPATASVSRYAVMVAVGYGINMAALIVLVPRMPLVMAQLTAVVLIVISNALFSFAWVFLDCEVRAPRRNLNP